MWINANIKESNVEIFFDRNSYRESLEQYTEQSNFYTVFTIYMFCDTEKDTNNNLLLLFNNQEIEYSPIMIILNKIYSKWRKKILSIIEEKIELFLKSQDVRDSLSYIYHFLHNKDGSKNEENLKKLLDHTNQTLKLSFLCVPNQDAQFTEYFCVRKFPSFIIGINSKLKTITHQNNPINLKSGNFETLEDFENWLNNQLNTMLDCYCETILCTWILKQTNNY